MDLFEAIEYITPLDIAESFNINIVRGRAACPFHNGRDRNLGFIKGSKWCHCFVCSKSWGSVALYKQLSGITDSVEAAKAIAHDFGIEYDETVSKQAIAAAMERKRARAERKALVEKGKAAFGRMLDKLRDDEMACIRALNRRSFDIGDDDQMNVAFAVVERLGINQDAIENLMALNLTTDDDFIEFYKSIGGDADG